NPVTDNHQLVASRFLLVGVKAASYLWIDSKHIKQVRRDRRALNSHRRSLAADCETHAGIKNGHSFETLGRRFPITIIRWRWHVLLVALKRVALPKRD